MKNSYKKASVGFGERLSFVFARCTTFSSPLICCLLPLTRRLIMSLGALTLTAAIVMLS